MTPEQSFDFMHPAYLPVFRARGERLKHLRDDPTLLAAVRAHYRANPWQLITDYGCTADPRNADVGLPTVTPFILFPRQVEWCRWVVESWQLRRPGITPKSRESGVSWLAVALSCALCTTRNGITIGFGSRLERYVDEIGSPKSLFWKARKFMELLPPEFRGSFRLPFDAPKMRLIFRDTGSAITGDAGDQIGRGDRATIYFVDEGAHLEHPELVDAALSQTTNCRIDIGTPNGIGNPFYQKVRDWSAHYPDRVFRFHWRDDPRKDQAWYDKQLTELPPVIIAQELDIDFAASVEGVIIPSGWVQAAVGAAERLGIVPSGERLGALDVADEGADNNAFGVAHGISVTHLEEWSGAGSDIFKTTQRAFGIADAHELTGFRYDADGLGAGVRGDARVIGEQRTEAAARAQRPPKPVRVEAFRGSGAVLNPTGQDVKGRTNEDFFQNLKAQSWWTLRRRFEQTFRAINGETYDPTMLISLPATLPLLDKLTAELSQPTYSLNAVGKIVVDKKPDGARSPNLGDVVMMLMGRGRRTMTISSEAVQRAGTRR